MYKMEVLTLEINPDHPATIGARDQWHKIVALLMNKLGLREVIISDKEVECFANTAGGSAVVIQFKDGVGIILRLLDIKEAERLAREEGGLPS